MYIGIYLLHSYVFSSVYTPPTHLSTFLALLTTNYMLFVHLALRYFPLGRCIYYYIQY